MEMLSEGVNDRWLQGLGPQADMKILWADMGHWESTPGSESFSWLLGGRGWVPWTGAVPWARSQETTAERHGLSIQSHGVAD